MEVMEELQVLVHLEAAAVPVGIQAMVEMEAGNSEPKHQEVVVAAVEAVN
jgi:spore maturation protein SpmA